MILKAVQKLIRQVQTEVNTAGTNMGVCIPYWLIVKPWNELGVCSPSAPKQHMLPQSESSKRIISK